jgi:flagellar biogenesis protein FliO
MDLSFVSNNPLLFGFLAILLGFVLFAYLFVRRIVTGFREGVENSRR